MAIDAQKYDQLKHRAEHWQNETKKAEGSLAILMNNLEEEFACDSLKTGGKLLKKLKKECDQAEDDFQQLEKDFEELWGDKLDEP